MKKFLLNNFGLNILLVVIFSSFVNSLQGQFIQQEPKWNKQIRLNYYFSKDLRNNLSSGFISPSVVMRDRDGDTHEIELTRLYFSDRYNDNSQYPYYPLILHRIRDFTLRYQYNIYFLDKEQRLKPYIGSAYIFSFYRKNSIPKAPGFYAANEQIINFSIAMVPGATFRVSKKIFFDLMLPLSFVNHVSLYQKSSQPGISTSGQWRGTDKTEYYFLKPLDIRMSMGVKF
ncbi:hypothetical protein BH23BAC1_BH23BAC1_11310 [soil metagenome]